MESKEYYQSVIRIVEYFEKNKGQYMISSEEAQELAGNYWPRIAYRFRDIKAGGLDSGGDFYLNKPHMLNPEYEDARKNIETIEKAEYDRELSNKEKLENIMYGRKAYRLSLVAILLSAIAVTVEIIKAITDSV